MQSLCYENPYQREFTAEIVETLEKDNRYHVVLDNTYFYKGGEDIPCDRGTINGSAVLGVFEKDDKVYHTLEAKPARIHRVKCEIDWKMRFDYMQQHLGRHIISGLLSENHNSSTLAFKTGEISSSIDIDKHLSLEELSRIEDLSNKAVFEGLEVEVFSPTNAELKKLKGIKVNKRPGEIVTLVKIGDWDPAACSEIHPKSTIEVQLIKITSLEKLKTGARIHYLCGARAVSDYIFKHESLQRITKALSCKPNDVLTKVEGLSSELNRALSEKRALKAEVADYEVKDMLDKTEPSEGVRIIKAIYDNVDIKYLDTLSSKLVSHPRVVTLFAARNQDRAQLLFMCSRDIKGINMSSLLKDAITLIDGKGGGSEFSAQGGGKDNNNLDSMMDYAYTKVKQNIML